MGFLNWPILKQIFRLCSIVMNFIYNNIVPNVGFAIILYALFAHVLFIPFSIKSRFDGKRNKKVADQIKALKSEFESLPEEERAKESVQSEFKKKEKALKKRRVSVAEGCLVMILRMLVLLATTPVVIYFEKFVGSEVSEVALNYNFLGLDLSSAAPGFSFQPTVILPIVTTLTLSIPGFISTIKNMRDREAMQAAKTPEELAEEQRMLEQMGIKDNKIPWGLIVQFAFAIFYFYSFSRIALTASLFWGAYYLIDYIIRGTLNYVSIKVSQQLHKGQREETHT